MMPRWVRDWLRGYGVDPEAIRAAYLKLGMSDDDYVDAIVRAFPGLSTTSDGTA